MLHAVTAQLTTMRAFQKDEDVNNAPQKQEIHIAFQLFSDITLGNM
jgi:hypothetical protein